MQAKIQEFFSNLTISQRFMLAGLLILLAGMAGIAAWIQAQIEAGVVHRTGATTALYVDSFVSPNLQELGHAGELDPQHYQALSKLLQDTPMGNKIVAFKVWDTQGRLMYSTDETAIGRSYPMTAGLLTARLGEVVTEFSALDEEENADLGAQYDQLLETYSPVWLAGTNQVIAVAEFYQVTEDLENELRVLKRRSWLVVGAVALGMYFLLAGFVRRTSDTISDQQVELEKQVVKLTGLLNENRMLSERVRRAAASVALLNESYLRRIGSELHDGPAQDLGLSLLKLDALAEQIESQPQRQNGRSAQELLDSIESALQSALKEVRGIATGLNLPQLAELSFPETVERAVRAHERKTDTPVNLEMEALPEQASLPIKITAYRVIQEALNNAFRHAGGAGQRVRVFREQEQITIQVSDSGTGFKPEMAKRREGHLGVFGMRERVESLGGQFEIQSISGQGTQVLARLPLHLEGGADE